MMVPTRDPRVLLEPRILRQSREGHQRLTGKGRPITETKNATTLGMTATPLTK